MARLLERLSLDAGSRRRFESVAPALDVYDYVNAMREDAGLRSRSRMLLRAVAAAGPLDFARLILRQAGLLRGWKYRKPLDQIRSFLGDIFIAKNIQPVELPVAPVARTPLAGNAA